MTKKALQIDIVSDVACPWCYIGKKHLEKALENFDSQPVEITWHPFQLDPTIPMEGLDRETYFINKFGSKERIEPMFERVVGVGQQAGIQLKFDKMPKVMNTIPLHKILHIAHEEGFQNELEERFFKAYFTDGVDFTNTQQVVAIMEEFGWTKEKTEGVLSSEEISYNVIQEIKHFQNLGISSVPFFIINKKYGISGAQPTSVFLDTLNKVSAEMKPVEAVGEACDINDKNC
ncbi:DSBA oxidoreductase [Emticicia oligotrophica DSM 17448]|uniref:DSBA oxidoreductase n=1 Tax=Emticicia oligotrophica (strain DSM 17448 / CIP 109782 / MTCC 6937 / GPTSA100-15) TaxID=929562 RepID=A0ABM5N143_EMTOG|nr:DsbA family oxidoreductase [Emticicia oligotrophica]AFK03115.1 DSBA oxidoreductase [Emticicia oligotrophica DSM 17448]